MNESKICPLLSISDPESLHLCEGPRCAWYVPPLGPRGEGRCAVQLMARCMPDLVDGVRRL